MKKIYKNRIYTRIKTGKPVLVKNPSYVWYNGPYVTFQTKGVRMCTVKNFWKLYKETNWKNEL